MRKLIIVAAMLCSTAVHGQEACADATKTTAMALEQYGEKPFIDMLEKQTRQLVIYANLETGTWTVFAYKPELDQLCAITAGSDFKPAVNRFGPKL